MFVGPDVDKCENDAMKRLKGSRRTRLTLFLLLSQDCRLARIWLSMT